jgi:NhaA family Na+:H+ antiporter
MPKSETLGPRVVPDHARDHCLGPASAKTSVVEYADFESPESGAAYWVVKELVEELEDRVCIAYRHLPLPAVHSRAEAAAEAAEAADAQGKFWLMHDRLFEHQSRLAPADLTEYAREMALDMATYERDLRSGTPARRVAEDVAGASRYGVRSTPTFFLNGVRYSGAVEFLPMLRVLEGSDVRSDRFDA